MSLLHRAFARESISRVLVIAATLLAAALAPAALSAQVGSTTDILTGIVKAPDGTPLVGATVTAKSAETQINRTKQTDNAGRYTIVFPDGGGTYQLTVRHIGMAQRTITVSHQGDEDQIITNISMTTTVQRLQDVVVRAAPQRNRVDPPTPGSTERILTPDQIARLPIDASDMLALATLAPGVVGLDGTDSTASAFSVAGQRADQNSITLDGLSYGANSVPQDAVRGTRVITSTYDVARGQFSGGQIASTTRSGTNVLQGTGTYSLRDPSFDVANPDDNVFARGYQQNSLSAGIGGPFIEDKFFGFGAFQLRRRTDALQSLIAADAATLTRLGTSPDSVAVFLNDLSRYGLTSSLPEVPGSRVNDNLSLFGRFDYYVTDEHTLMLRLDYRKSSQGAARIGTYSVPTTGGDQKSDGGGVMLMLTSHLGSFINEVRAYRSNGGNSSDPYLELPSGRVQLASALPDGTLGVSVLSFGGNSSLPQSSLNNGFEGSEELSWLSGRSGHRAKLGLLVNSGDFTQNFTPNRFGTFTFASLADYEALRPSAFTRTLTTHEKTGGSTNAAVYLGDVWRKSNALQLTYGLRLEGSRYSNAPVFNPAVAELFGRRTDFFPTEVHLSPRVGFSWTIGAQNQGAAGGFGGQQALGTIRGGIGEFRGVVPTQLFSAAQDATGLINTQSQLVCIGAAVPAPDFPSYLQSLTNIPESCKGGSSTPAFAARPNVTTFDKDFGAPRSWRASLGVQRRFWQRYNFTLDLSYARGVNQYGFRDLNLNESGGFTLVNEGNRPVFVPAGTIIPATGTAASIFSRVHPEYGQVIAVSSDLKSDTKQATTSLGGFTMRGLQFQASYTFTHSRDQSSFPGGFGGGGIAATTAADPNSREWARSDLERRHSLVVTSTYPWKPWVEFTAVGRMSSGAPFTPIVGSDINGDGARNDRAFIFNPASGDTAIANGLTRLLASSPSRVRECLTSSFGSVAGRNVCTGPWTPNLDMQANFRPASFHLDRRLTISLLTVNLLSGVDQLLHGSNNLSGWGQPNRADPTLLYVRGFDPSTNSYKYAVNERFGVSHGSINAIRTPFQFSIQVRYALGPDPARERIQQVFANGGGGGRGGGAAGMLERLVPNPMDSIIAIRDTLKLTDDQVTRLKVLSDTLAAKNGLIADTLRAQIEKAGNGPDLQALFGQIRPKLTEARANMDAALKAAQGVLTAEQWAKVPARIKNPPQNGGGGPGRGGRPPQ